MKLNTIQARKKMISRFYITSWCLAVIATFTCALFEAYYRAVFLSIAFLILPILVDLCFDSKADANDIVRIIQRAKDHDIELGALREEAINALLMGDNPYQLWNLYCKIDNYTNDKINERDAEIFEQEARKKRQAAYKSALEQLK